MVREAPLEDLGHRAMGTGCPAASGGSRVPGLGHVPGPTPTPCTLFPEFLQPTPFGSYSKNKEWGQGSCRLWGL